jgi:hypothetical protein
MLSATRASVNNISRRFQRLGEAELVQPIFLFSPAKIVVDVQLDGTSRERLCARSVDRIEQSKTAHMPRLRG